MRQHRQQGVTRDDRRQISAMLVRLDDGAAEPPPGSSRIATRSVPLRLRGDLVLELHQTVEDLSGRGGQPGM